MSSYRFRPIARSDFPVVGGWLAQPHVLRWWADDPTAEGVEAAYGGTVDGTEPAEVFIGYRQERALGLAQRLRLDAYPQYLQDIEAITPVPTGIWSIDYLIGAPEDTRRGWGTEMIRAFIDRLWQETPAQAVIVPVHASNIDSWRALERAGFALIANGLLEPDNPADDRSHLLYRIDRPGPAP